MQDRFSYGPDGALNHLHKKLFTGTELQNLLTQTGFQIDTAHSIITNEPNESTNNLINLLTQISKNKSRKQYLTYKYVIIGKRL